jgi:pyruvate/2-oxoglutarate dehydrogenase complex dihydrolipoamide dehydrogenase (E3) component/anti-anti-sigma regulatory factor
MLMNPSYDYDLIVIGAGIAGMVSAVTANGLGKRVAVVEKSRFGGNCTNSTCIPSKALIRLSKISHDISCVRRVGLLNDSAGKMNRRKIMPHIRRIVQRAYEKDLPETFEAIGIRIIPGNASFVDPHRIMADGQTLSAQKFIIASGTSPMIPDIPGLRGIDFLTNETLYALEDMPRSIIILGGGVDGLEYASAFGRLGVETTVIEMAERMIPQADRELVRQLLRSLRTDGIRLITGVKAMSLENRPGSVGLKYQPAEGPIGKIAADKVLVAVGRKPLLEGLCLEKAGVTFNARGIITDRRLRTSAPHIYACGDIAGPFQLASTAEAQGITAATNAFLPVKRSVGYRNNVYVIFTEPPLAWIGMTEEQARARYGRRLRVYRFPYEAMRRALIDGNEAGMAKILCDGRGRIVGAHILGEGAGEVIHELQAIRGFHKPLHKLQPLTHAYPTYAQAIVGRASQLAFLDRMGKNIFVNIALRLLPGFANRLDLARNRLAETHPFDAFAEFTGAEGPAANLSAPPSGPPGPGSQETGNGLIVDSRRVDPETVILDIGGVLTASGEKELTGALDGGMTAAKRILLNLSGLAHMNVEGAGLLLVNTCRAARKNIALSACGLPGPLRDVFRLMGLDRVMALYDDEEDALCFRHFLEKTGLSVSPGPADQASPPGWAKSVDRLTLTGVPPGVMNINVEGRRTSSPVQGFGRLWEKRYRLRLHDTDLDPGQIISLWRTEFADFWPKGNHLFTSGNGPIAPGKTALLNLTLPGGLVLATGFIVIHADDTSFSFMTAEGHTLSGWITFSCFRMGASTFIQVHPLFRAGDPIIEIGFRLGAAVQEDRFWHETLGNLACRLGTHGEVTQRNILVDPHIRWSGIANLRHSAAIRSALYMPVHLLKKCFTAKNEPGRSVKG